MFQSKPSDLFAKYPHFFSLAGDLVLWKRPIISGPILFILFLCISVLGTILKERSTAIPFISFVVAGFLLVFCTNGLEFVQQTIYSVFYFLSQVLCDAPRSDSDLEHRAKEYGNSVNVYWDKCCEGLAKVSLLDKNKNQLTEFGWIGLGVFCIIMSTFCSTVGVPSFLVLIYAIIIGIPPFIYFDVPELARKKAQEAKEKRNAQKSE